MAFTERNEEGLTEEEFLKNYRPGDYERPSNTVDMLLFTIDDKQVEDIRKDEEKEIKVLLIRRRNHPDIHKWALPGGFVDMQENLDAAVYRELAEETNVRDVYMEQLYTFGDVGRDKRTRVISIAYMALAPRDSLKPKAGDDAEEVAWFSVEKTQLSENRHRLTIRNSQLNLHYTYTVDVTYRKNGVVNVPMAHIYAEGGEAGIAFDHVDMINAGIDRLRNKIEYVPVAFNLVPDKFTLNEIQKVYEVIWGKKLVKQNFRKWIDKFVEELDEKQEKVGHRPATLYRYKEKNISL